MEEWIPITTCTPAEDYVVIAAWYNHRTEQQFVYESQYSAGQWITETEHTGDGWEVTHWTHFPDPPPIEDVLAVRWQSSRELLRMSN